MFLLVSFCPLLRSVPGLVSVIRPLYCGTLHVCLSFSAGFGVVLAYFVMPTPLAQSQDLVWESGHLFVAQDKSVLRVLFFFVPPIPPSSRTGGDLGILPIPTVVQDCVNSCEFSFSEI